MMRAHVILSDAPSTGYRAAPSESWPSHWAVLDARGSVVDLLRVRAVAEYLAGKLNTGQARVDSHACIGCRISMVIDRSEQGWS